MKLKRDIIQEVLTRHRQALYSWGPEDCTCPDWTGSVEDHPAHQADMVEAALYDYGVF